jgi:hypothetical protein
MPGSMSLLAILGYPWTEVISLRSDLAILAKRRQGTRRNAFRARRRVVIPGSKPQLPRAVSPPVA